MDEECVERLWPFRGMIYEEYNVGVQEDQREEECSNKSSSEINGRLESIRYLRKQHIWSVGITQWRNHGIKHTYLTLWAIAWITISTMSCPPLVVPLREGQYDSTVTSEYEFVSLRTGAGLRTQIFFCWSTDRCQIQLCRLWGVWYMLTSIHDIFSSSIADLVTAAVLI